MYVILKEADIKQDP